MVPAAITTDAFARPNSSEFDTRVIIALGFPSWDCVQAFSGIAIRSVFSVTSVVVSVLSEECLARPAVCWHAQVLTLPETVLLLGTDSKIVRTILSVRNKFHIQIPRQ